MQQKRVTKPTTKPDHEVVADLPETDAADLTPTDDLLAELDEVVVNADSVTDDLLLDTVRAEKPDVVKAGQAIPTVRAWMLGGRVD